MRVNISQVKALLSKANQSGYEPLITINGEFYTIDYKNEKQSENAKLIVKAVNNHQALVNCVQDAIRYFKEHNIYHNIVRQLTVALEKAEG